MRKVIPFHDLKRQYAHLKNEVMRQVGKVCRMTAFSGGQFVEEFEKNFAKFCGAKYCVGLNNGTNALHLAMLTLGMKRGDEVIVPANTFIATAWGVSYVGATPVFVDCDDKTWEISPTEIEKRITAQTKAIIGVHLYGQPFDVDAVRKISQKHGLFLVEDCAQAHGARYRGRKVGTLGDIACWSFYPGKNLGAYGEAGAITTNKQKIAQQIAKLKNHGSLTKYFHEIIGFNMRMEGIQGAILNLKLKYLNSWNRRRRQIAKMYQTKIKNKKIICQFHPAEVESVYHLFVVVTSERDKLKKYLLDHQIGCGLHYPVPCHLQKAYRFLHYKKGDCPNSEYLAAHCLSLPMFPELRDDEVERVIKVINRY